VWYGRCVWETHLPSWKGCSCQYPKWICGSAYIQRSVQESLMLYLPQVKINPSYKNILPEINRKGCSRIISCSVWFCWPLTLSYAALSCTPSPHTLICRDNAYRAASGWWVPCRMRTENILCLLVQHKHSRLHPRVTGMDFGWMVKSLSLIIFMYFHVVHSQCWSRKEYVE
jgi:hypothetical protein